MKTETSSRLWHWPFIAATVLLLFGFTTVSASADDEDLNTEDFTYKSWDLTYELEIVDDVVLTHVTEELVAEFPDFDQNRGIVRGIPMRHFSAPSDPQDITVTDGEGNDVPFDTERDEGNRVILVGDDEFVHGQQTYRISYTLPNIIHSGVFDTGPDRFSYNLVPRWHAQPIEEVSGQVILSPELAEAVTEGPTCEVRNTSSSSACEISEAESEENTWTITSNGLDPNSGMRVAFGFAPGTGPEVPERQDNWMLDSLPIVLAVASAVTGIIAVSVVIAMRRKHRNATGGQTAPLGPPEEVPMLISAEIVSVAYAASAAEIVRLAVRGAVRIEKPDPPTSKFDTNRPPKLTLLDPSLAKDPLEKQVLEAIFEDLQPGETVVMPTKDKEQVPYLRAMNEAGQEARKQAASRGYMATVRSSVATGWAVAGLLMTVSAVLLLIMGWSRDNVDTVVISILAALVGIPLSVIAMWPQRVLTPQGAILRQQLDALIATIKDYEPQRTSRLVSAVRDRHQSADRADERDFFDQMLPYAILFGLDADWIESMKDAYQESGLEGHDWFDFDSITGSTGSLQSSLWVLASVTSNISGGSGGGGGVSVGGGGGGGGGFAGGR